PEDPPPEVQCRIPRTYPWSSLGVGNQLPFWLAACMSYFEKRKLPTASLFDNVKRRARGINLGGLSFTRGSRSLHRSNPALHAPILKLPPAGSIGLGREKVP